MEIGSQIRKHRTELGLSQEALAEKVFVSRQTVSNWETEKNYPDINSLVLLSSLFGISLDELVKGDIEVMKKEIRKEDISEFNVLSRSLGILWILTLLSVIFTVANLDNITEPLGIISAVVSVMLFASTFIVSLKVEKFKNKHELHTYREIVEFTEGKNLDEIAAAREEGKRGYQKVLAVLCGAGVAIVVILIGILLSKLIG